MTQWKPIALVCASALALAACGSTTTDRAISGGAVGAATGAVAGALIPGLSVVGGTVIGAGLGAVTGALTKQEQIDLGKPAWK